MTTVLQPMTLTADMDTIRAYGELTDDFNPIHLDPEFAAKTAMGGCIAHGTMSIGLLWQSLYATLGEAAAGGIDLDVRFVRPVRAGETITAGGRQQADDPRTYDVWVRGADEVDRLTGTARLRTSRGA